MKKFFPVLLLLLHLLAAPDAGASVIQPMHQQINKLATTFIQQQTANIAGKVDYQIESLDSRITLTPCDKLEAFLPNGSQLIGKTSIGIRCATPKVWQILVPAKITVTLALLVSARQLQPGQVLRPTDIAKQPIEISQATGFTDPDQVIGKVLRYGIAAGQILRNDMLRLPYSIIQGQTVQITAQGNGFSIRNEGVAMNNASEGQTVQIRVASGRTISGTARNGIVEITP